MRSIILVVGTLFLTLGVFVTYRVFQPVPQVLTGANAPTVQVVPVHGSAPRFGAAGQGDRPWIRNIDRLGRLASQFKADEYQPRGGGHVHVIQPRAEFFQYAGGHVQKIVLESETGDIEVQQPAHSGSASFEKGAAGPPKRGRLKRGAKPVTIKLYPDIVGQKDHVSITLATDNLKFDNETFEISTGAITDPGGNEIVPADQVPIHVTGDYEFEGKGLLLRWNDLEGRLEYLEIPHGDRLTIVHPSGTSFGGSDSKKPSGEPGAATTQPSRPGPSDSGTQADIAVVAPPVPLSPVPTPVLASASASPAGRKADAAKPAKHGPQPPYKADFERDVRITQGARSGDEKQVGTADRMTVDFVLNQSKPATQPTTAPASPANLPTRPEPTGPTPTVAGAVLPGGDSHGSTGATGNVALAGSGQAATTGPSAIPSTEPSTRPSDGSEPVNVYWVGKLVVQPNPDLSPGALQPGQSIVHLIGDSTPVHVARDANDVVCARLDYHSPEGNVTLEPSPAFPQVVVRQLAASDAGLDPQADPESAPPDDAVVTSERIDYSAVDHIAFLHGNSEAKVQLKADPSDPAGPTRPGVLDVRWNKLAQIYFLNHPAPPIASAGKSSRQQMAVDHAHLEGDVDLRHPQLALKSQSLDAAFASVLAPVTSKGAVLLPSPQSAADADKAVADSTVAHDGNVSAAAPSTRPVATMHEQTILRHLVATDAVTCEMTDEGGKKQNVECHQLTMDTALSPIGKLYPKKIDFSGDSQADAHAFDQTQDIHAGEIGLTFVPAAAATASTRPVVVVARATTGPATQPTTRPVELETMTATDRVRVETTQGASASAERLYVQMIDGQPHARLTGRPGAGPGTPQSLATVIDAKKNVIIGPTIVSDPRQNIATVKGPGSMHLIRQDSPTDKPRPIDITFLQRAVMDSPDNIIDIREAVSVVSADPDGTINTATGRHVHITLADKPPEATGSKGTTRPSTHPSQHAAAVTRPANTPAMGPSTQPGGTTLADSAQVNLMKGKVVTGLVLENDAVVKSNLTDVSGAILRQSELKADLIRYILASTQPGAKGMFIVPVPGQMLVRDHRPPAPPVAAGGKAPAAPVNAGNPGDSRGATAFQWSRQLTYDETTSTAVFTGDVLIVHQDDDAKDEPARLRADKVVAVFEPRPNRAAKPLAPQPGQPAQPASQMQLKSMTATGNVSVTRAASELDAPRMDYDPVTGWMSAIGTAREPASFLDATGVNSATAGQIDWNSQTWNVKFKDIISRTGRR